MTYVTPFLPEAAKLEVRSHEGQRKIVVHRVIEGKDSDACKNCAGEGIVYLSFLGIGPTKTPLGASKPSTFVEADGTVAGGWYAIERTQGYRCPACQEQRPIPKRTQKRPEVQASVADLVFAREIPRGDQ